MSRVGHVQTRQAEHKSFACLSDWAQSAAVAYLWKKGISVYTGDSSVMTDPDNSDHWEIELPIKKTRGGKYGRDVDRMNRIIADLRKHPWKVKGEDGKSTFGDQLADVLEEGMKAAEKHDYDWIMVDFW